MKNATVFAGPMTSFVEQGGNMALRNTQVI